MAKDEEIARRLGEAAGRALKSLLGPSFGDRLRAYYAAKYGVCRGCGAPLGGSSPEQICESCHANEVLAETFGGQDGGEA